MSLAARQSKTASPICKMFTEDGLRGATIQCQISHVSAVHQLSGRIDPSRLPKDFSCEPELFPATMVRRHGLHFMCHLSGKTMITGIIRVSDLNYFYTILLEFELYL